MKKLLRYRIFYIIISVCCALNAVVFIVVGLVRAVQGYITFIRDIGKPEFAVAGLMLLQSLDAFLIGLVLLIFSFGIFRIFVNSHEAEQMPPWLKNIHTLSDLKLMLWEAILLVMLIFSLSYMSEHRGKLDFYFLLLPGVILMTATSYFLIKKAEKHSKD